ncbi:uncharacterized protein PV07_10885 [Cladophialophora immunda]|uniref:Uncharacterized protein n=1 Tax=Cladophialophora immunda TaxID=569365 RepID=A0A0D2CGG4_9EURO|nr:uncharacterized protein PV07_10885 [Cladophialophora immunda]KIW22604.1 hypothetical protein PV07_10885 [Cladophialophora immunda]
MILRRPDVLCVLAPIFMLVEITALFAWVCASGDQSSQWFCVNKPLDKRQSSRRRDDVGCVTQHILVDFWLGIRIVRYGMHPTSCKSVLQPNREPKPVRRSFWERLDEHLRLIFKSAFGIAIHGHRYWCHLNEFCLGALYLLEDILLLCFLE